VWRLHQVCRVCGGSPQKCQVPWLLHKAKTEGSAGGEGIRARREASSQGTRDVVVGLASDGSKTVAKACPPNGNIHFLNILP
jgi:hypothetical protein